MKPDEWTVLVEREGDKVVLRAKMRVEREGEAAVVDVGLYMEPWQARQLADTVVAHARQIERDGPPS